MAPGFEELDRQSTPMGEISLRRRTHLTLGVDLVEVILGDEHLMSDLFTAGEIALADLGLAEVTGDDLAVLVGGLGLGYTAAAALRDRRVAGLQVVDAVEAVIGWHQRGLLPLSAELTGDPRCELVHDDFFAAVAEERTFGTEGVERYDAVLVDIDHTPSHLLDEGHRGFYSVEGLTRLARRITPGGTFGLWSDAAPDDAFTSLLSEVFATARAEVVTFPNPHTGGEAANTVYLATGP